MSSNEKMWSDNEKMQHGNREVQSDDKKLKDIIQSLPLTCNENIYNEAIIREQKN